MRCCAVAASTILVRLLLQDGACDRKHIVSQFPGRLQRGFTADTGPATGPGRTTVRSHFGVASDDLHARAVDAEMLGDDLTDDGLGALPQLGDRDQAADVAGRCDFQDRAILRGNTCAADAVKSRARVGDLDERHDADAAMNTPRPQFGLLSANPIIVHHCPQLCETGVMRQRFELVAGRRRARIGIVRNQVTRTDIQNIESGLGSDHVHQPLGDGASDRMPHSPVLAHLHLVLKHDLQIGAVVLETVRCAHQPEDLIAFDDAGSGIGGERADTGHVLHIHCEDSSVCICCHAGANAVIAGVNIGDEGFDAIGDIFDRTAKHPTTAMSS